LRSEESSLTKMKIEEIFKNLDSFKLIVVELLDTAKDVYFSSDGDENCSKNIKSLITTREKNRFI
jgi:hypothetical protein